MRSLKLSLISLAVLSVIGLYLSRVVPGTQIWQSKTTRHKVNLLDGQWQYMPGSNPEAGKLRIRDSGFGIVSKDGSNDQPNPPLNLFGTRLAKVDDFAVEAVVERNEGEASLQLYAKPPLIQDEFRIDSPSLKITLLADSLKIKTPDISRSFSVVAQPKERLKITIIDDTLSLYLNGTLLDRIEDKNIFESGDVWFGADSKKGSWLLAELRAEPLNSDNFEVVDAATLLIPRKDPAGFQLLADTKRPGFLTGAAMALGPLTSDPSYAKNALGGNFGSMTIENALKWQFIEPREGQYDYHEADALIALAKRHNMAVHGHTLVFGEANPAWVSSLPTVTAEDKQRVKKVMQAHITNVMGHYRGEVSTWDVVNEPLADYADFSETAPLRRHQWYRAMGEDYIAEAFRAARLADSKAKLFINEYGLEEDGERWDAFVKLIKRLKASGVPIDGVGFQAHVFSSGDAVDATVLRRHIRQMEGLGLTVRISETDVHSNDGKRVQAQQYAEILSACLAEPACTSWTTWGISDRYNLFKNESGKIEYGEDFLWDYDMCPTPAVYTIKQVLRSR